MLNRLAKLREERENGDNGFTLIELLVVVVIIGILIAIAIPLYLNYKKGANDKAAQSDLRGAVSTIEQCNSDNAAYPNPAAQVILTASGSLTGCTNVINLSANTSLAYKTVTTPSAGYIAASTNSSGSGKFYCYNSTAGGSVTSVTAASLAAATC
jgi:type IV pilus assembly protein PilA